VVLNRTAALRCNTRSNSTSTVKVSSTMAKPDNVAVIRAVSSVLRKYILEGDEEVIKNGQGSSAASTVYSPLTVFNEAEFIDDSSSEEENYYEDGYTSSEDEEYKISEDDVETKGSEAKTEPEFANIPRLRLSRPAVSDIAAYLTNMFETAQCSEDCNIICLIYVERLMKCCQKNKLLGKQDQEIESMSGLNSDNWRGILMVAMLLASKVWDDLSMVNEDFSIFMPYSLQQINSWEVHFLSCVGFNVRVSASEYAKYYFDLRKHYHRLGEDLPPMRELNMKQAAKLEILSSGMEQRTKDMLSHKDILSTESNLPLLRRAKSCTDRSADENSPSKGSSPCRYVID